MSFLRSNRFLAKERRTGFERRVSEDLCYFRNGGTERRNSVDRRQGREPVCQLLPTQRKRSLVRLFNWLIQ